MGSVDRMDQNVDLDRIGNLGNKWWSCIFSWLNYVCVENALLLLISSHPAIPQQEFRREIVI